MSKNETNKYTIRVRDLETQIKLNELREKIGTTESANSFLEYCLKLGVNQLEKTIELGERASQTQGGIETLIEQAIANKDLKGLVNLSQIKDYEKQIKHIELMQIELIKKINQIGVDLMAIKWVSNSIFNYEVKAIQDQPVSAEELLSGSLASTPNTLSSLVEKVKKENA